MKNNYFKYYQGDKLTQRGREVMGFGYNQNVTTRTHPSPEKVDHAILIERVWTTWYGEDFIVGPDFVASWLDRPLGYSMHKVKSLNPFLDRCVIENEHSYAIFDLFTRSSRSFFHSLTMDYTFIVYDVKEYAIDGHDEILLKLSL